MLFRTTTSSRSGSYGPSISHGWVGLPPGLLLPYLARLCVIKSGLACTLRRYPLSAISSLTQPTGSDSLVQIRFCARTQSHHCQHFPSDDSDPFFVFTGKPSPGHDIPRLKCCSKVPNKVRVVSCQLRTQSIGAIRPSGGLGDHCCWAWNASRSHASTRG